MPTQLQSNLQSAISELDTRISNLQQPHLIDFSYPFVPTYTLDTAISTLQSINKFLASNASLEIPLASIAQLSQAINRCVSSISGLVTSINTGLQSSYQRDLANLNRQRSSVQAQLTSYITSKEYRVDCLLEDVSPDLELIHSLQASQVSQSTSDTPPEPLVVHLSSKDTD